MNNSFKYKSCWLSVASAIGLLVSEQALALTTNSCSEAILDLLDTCSNTEVAVDSSMHLNLYQNIRDNCFCNPIQGNNGGGYYGNLSCGSTNDYQSSFTLTNNKASKIQIFQSESSDKTKYYQLNYDGTSKNPESTNTFSNSGFCNVISASPSLVNNNTNRLHNITDMITDVFGNTRGAFSSKYNTKTLLKNCPRKVLNIVDANNIGGSTPINLGTNSNIDQNNQVNLLINGGTMGVNLGIPFKGILISNSPINILSKSSSSNAYILTSDDISLEYSNKKYTGGLNAKALEIKVEGNSAKLELERSYNNKACPGNDCIDSDIANESYRILTSQNNCQSLKVTVQKCNNSGTACSALPSDKALNLNVVFSDGKTIGGQISSTPISLDIDKDITSVNLSIEGSSKVLCGQSSTKSASCTIDLTSCSAGANDTVLWVNEQNKHPMITLDEEALKIFKNPETIASTTAKIKFKKLDSNLPSFTIVTDNDPQGKNVLSGSVTEEEVELSVGLIKNNKGAVTGFYPNFKVTSLVNPNQVAYSVLSLEITYNNETPTQNIDYIVQPDTNLPKLVVVPLALCLNMNEISNQEYTHGINSAGTNYQLLEANKPYTLKYYAVGCTNEICPTNFSYSDRLSINDLAKLCSESAKITPSANTQYTQEVTLATNSIEPSCYNSWSGAPYSGNCYVKTGEDDTIAASAEITECNTDLDNTTNENVLRLGYTNNSVCSRIKNSGWFSFTNESPLLISSSSKPTLFYSPVYTVLPTAIKVTDSTLNDFTYSYKALSKTLDIGNIEALRDLQSVGSETCPTYFKQKLLLSGYLTGVDTNNQFLSGFSDSFFVNNNSKLNLQPLYRNDNTNNVTPESFFNFNDSYNGFGKYVHEHGLAFHNVIQINKENILPTSVLLGYTAELKACLASNNSSRTFDKATDCEYPLKTKQNKTFKDLKNSGGVSSEKWDIMDHVGSTVFYSGRLITEPRLSESDVYTPLSIQIYDHGTQNQNESNWIVSHDSCSTLYLKGTGALLYDRDFAQNLHFYKDTYSTELLEDNPQRTNNNINLVSDSADYQTEVKLCNSIHLDNQVCMDDNMRFINGILWLKAKRPTLIDNKESYSNFELKPTPSALSTSDKLYPLDHLFNVNTSRGTFVFRELIGNKRVIYKDFGIPLEEPKSSSSK